MFFAIIRRPSYILPTQAQAIEMQRLQSAETTTVAPSSAYGCARADIYQPPEAKETHRRITRILTKVRQRLHLSMYS